MTWPPPEDTPLDPQMRAFLDAVADRPDDLAVRLVFADWLEERADPRAPLLRLQAEYLRLGESSPECPAVVEKIRAWEAAHRRDWFGEWPASLFLVFKLETGLLQVMQDETQRVLESDELNKLWQALREGWFSKLSLMMWNIAPLAEAARRGLLAGPRALDLFGGRGDNARLQCLRDLPRLRQLRIQAADTSVDDQGLVHLGTLTGLRELCLRHCLRVTGTGLADLAPLTELRFFSVEGCSRLNDAAMIFIAAYSRLESLNLGHCPALTEGSLSHLAGFSGLRELELAGWNQLTVAGLNHLRPLTNLRRLSLERCVPLPDAGLDCLLELPHLEELNLSGCTRITAAAITRLTRLPRLRRLNLTGCTLRGPETRAIRKALPQCEVVR